MATYTCDKFRPITGIDTPREAAFLFAQRYARKEFGGRGRCHHVRLDCASADGRYGLYEAFIGVPCKGGGMSGHNVRFAVYAEPQPTAGNVKAWM